jgi:hypothetical protein
VLWQRLDRPGHEAARLTRDGAVWRLDGSVVLADADRACRLEYEIVCDAQWRTRNARVTGWIAGTPVSVQLECDGSGVWRRDGRPAPGVAGCIDVDLGFTPSTNTLPIRRLTLDVGASAPVRAAWLRFPELTLESLEQVYRRTAERTYRYESAGGQFVAVLEVGAAGLVSRYGDYWRAEVGPQAAV